MGRLFLSSISYEQFMNCEQVDCLMIAYHNFQSKGIHNPCSGKIRGFLLHLQGNFREYYKLTDFKEEEWLTIK